MVRIKNIYTCVAPNMIWIVYQSTATKAQAMKVIITVIMTSRLQKKIKNCPIGPFLFTLQTKSSYMHSCAIARFPS